MSDKNKPELEEEFVDVKEEIAPVVAEKTPQGTVKVKMKKTYCGSLGNYYKNNIYTMDKAVVSKFGKDELEICS